MLIPDYSNLVVQSRSTLMNIIHSSLVFVWICSCFIDCHLLLLYIMKYQCVVYTKDKVFNGLQYSLINVLLGISHSDVRFYWFIKIYWQQLTFTLGLDLVSWVSYCMVYESFPIKIFLWWKLLSAVTSHSTLHNIIATKPDI